LKVTFKRLFKIKLMTSPYVRLKAKQLLSETFFSQKYIYTPTLIKSSRNSFRKFKIQFYSSKVILSPSKYSPSTATHLCQRLIQLSKHFWNSIVGIAIRAVFDFSITSFRLLKRVPRNGFLTWIEKNRREPYQMNSMAVGWYSFRSCSKIHSLQIQFHF